MMKAFSYFVSALAVVLLGLLLVPGRTAAAGEGEPQQREERFKLVLATPDSEGMETVEFEGLEVGESRHITTESGKPVTVTRDEEGYLLDIDGREMRVGHGPGGIEIEGCEALETIVEMEGEEGDTEARRHVVVHRMHHGDDGEGEAGDAKTRRRVVIKTHGDGDLSEEDLDSRVEEILAEIEGVEGAKVEVDVDVRRHGEGDEDCHVVVIKKRKMLEEETEEGEP